MPGVETDFTVEQPGVEPLPGTLGYIGDLGRGAVEFVLPAGSDPALVGVVAHHALAVFDLVTLGLVGYSTDPARLELLP